MTELGVRGGRSSSRHSQFCNSAVPGPLGLAAINRKFTSRVMIVLATFTCLILCVTPSFAQVDTGRVTGTVRDQSGGVIPGTKVTLTSEGTKVSRSVVTDNTGLYIFAPVRVGSYTVSVEQQGFEAMTHPDIVVNIQQDSVVDFSLRPGAVTETIEVTGAPTLLQTTEGSVGQVVNSDAINDLPLNGRNFTFLAQLVAGVTPMQLDDRGLRASGSFAANGTTYQQSNYILNGIDNNNTQPDLVGGTTFAVLPPIDSLEEFKVQTSNYSAEFGRAGGAVVNATLKSGTTHYHGDVWEFLRNDKLDAADFFENAANQLKSEFRQNQFGITLGGPVSIPRVYQGKDHTFFFVDYEGTRIRQGTPEVETVPTLAERNSRFTDLSDLLADQPGTTPPDLLNRTFSLGQVFDPATTRAVTAGQADPVTGLVAAGTGYVRDPFSGNTIPSDRIDPNAVNLLDLFPLPTQAGLFDNYTASPVQKKDTNSFDARIDENISERDQTFVTFDYNHTGWIDPPPFPGIASGGSDFRQASDSFTSLMGAWSETHIFSPSTINELRAGFTRKTTYFKQFGNDQLGIPEEFGIQGIPQVPGNGGLPSMTIGFYTNLGDWGFLPTYKYSNVWDIRENLTRVQGRHTLKGGVEYQNNFMPFLVPPWSRGYFLFSGAYTSIPGDNLGTTGAAQFLVAPAPTSVSNGIDNVGGADLVQASNSVQGTEYRHYYAGYFQDDWKASSKLSLNLGLRYEYFSPYMSRHDQQANLVPGPPFEGAEYLYPTSRQTNPSLPAVFLNTLAKDGIAIKYANNVNGNSPSANWAPRFGFAYRATPHLVVRGGYGISYSGMEISSGVSNWGTFNFPFLFNYSLTPPDPAHPITANNSIGLLENGLLNIPLTASALTSGQLQGLSLLGREFKFPEPSVQATNFTLQYQLTPNQSVQAAYVGTLGRHLEGAPGVNYVSEILPPLVNIFDYLPYPDFSQGLTYSNYAASNYYHSLQVTFRRAFAGGLSFLANYTWSKSRTDLRDDLEDDIGYYRAPDLLGFGLKGDYGLSDFDVRNVVHFSGTYQLPFGHGKQFLARSGRWTNGVLGGWLVNWILTLQDGMPATIPCTISTAAGLGCNALLVPGQNPIAGPHNVNQWLNPQAFANPPVATTIGQTDLAPLGGAPTQVIGPGFHRLDFSLFKQFKTSEKTDLEFRAEFFNLTNTPNFIYNSNSNNTNFESPAFGEITSTIDNPNDPRQIQFALKFYF